MNHPAPGAAFAAAQDDPGYGLFEPVEETVRQFITFTIGAQEYGVDVMAVKEIRGWGETTTLPNAPDYVRGIINLRGSIVPIYDLRTRFGQGLTEVTPTHVVIIVTVGARILGLLVDAVSDILSVPGAAIAPVPDLDARSDTAFLAGLVAVEQRMVTLIAVDRLLPDGGGDDAALN